MVINLFFFYLKLVALVSYLSTLKSQISILSIISLLIFITAGFCVCMLVGLVCFLTLYLLHSNSFLLIFRELYTYMYNVCCPASCPMYSFSCACKHPCCLLTFPPFCHVGYSSLYIWSKTAGVLWKSTWVYFFIPFLCLLKKNHYHEEPAILSLNSVSFAGRVVYSRGYKPSFFLGFLLFCPCPTPVSHPACCLEVRILQWIFVSFLHSNSSS